MDRRKGWALAGFVGIWAVIAVMVLVPVSAASSGPAVAGPSSAVSAAAGTHPGLGAPGPLHGKSVGNKLPALKDATFPPAAPSASPKSFVPGCLSTACPMGVTDYGIAPNGTSYTWNAPTVGAYADVSTLLIGAATGGGCLDPDALHCMTLQENSIATGVEVENQKGDYWLQDVPEIGFDGVCSAPCVSHEYSVTWLDNIWNMTSSSGSNLNAATLTGNLTGHCSSFAVAPSGSDSFYYCVGPTDYGLTTPFTVWAMTNTGPNGNKYFGYCPASTDSCVQFWGAIFEGSNEPFFGWYDEVQFTAGTAGGGHPVIHVANSSTPFGLPFDSEWDMCGPGGGSSVALSGESVAMQSLYNTGAGSSGTNPGTWVNIKHAWSSGEDTAETSTHVDMYGYFGYRQLASATKGTDNPGVSLW